jgi:hypothetical protein
MRQLRVEAEGISGADPEVVWSLIADANSYPSWGPWNDGGYQPTAEDPSRKGAVQWFRQVMIALIAATNSAHGRTPSPALDGQSLGPRA